MSDVEDALILCSSIYYYYGMMFHTMMVSAAVNVNENHHMMCRRMIRRKWWKDNVHWYWLLFVRSGPHQTGPSTGRQWWMREWYWLWWIAEACYCECVDSRWQILSPWWSSKGWWSGKSSSSHPYMVRSFLLTENWPWYLILLGSTASPSTVWYDYNAALLEKDDKTSSIKQETLTNKRASLL